jgi:hypothetical protein
MRSVTGGSAAVGVGLGVVVLLLAGLAGCSTSGGSAGATTTTSGQQAAAAVWRELVRCARANGMPNLPDPQLDSNGRASFPNGTPSPPASVRRACQSIYDRLPPSARGEEERPPADRQALLRFARCMREHGVPDFPDPDAEGNFRAPAGALPGGSPDSPSVKRALQACRQLDPNKGASRVGPGPHKG